MRKIMFTFFALVVARFLSNMPSPGINRTMLDTWINSNEMKTLGVMDILSGNAERAPEMYQKLGLEWFYRLVQDPSRIKRQIVLPKFMLKVIFSKGVIK